MQSRTILIIDDDPDVRESLRMVLGDNGFQVSTAPDGEIGIAKALQDRPSLIIVDMMMPRVSGFIVVEQLKQHHRLNTPIIMLTGHDNDHQRAYAEFVGADLYLTKPLPTKQLVQAIDQVCPADTLVMP
jgi:DNA-binding response OmpR family regulator